MLLAGSIMLTGMPVSVAENSASEVNIDGFFDVATEIISGTYYGTLTKDNPIEWYRCNISGNVEIRVYISSNEETDCEFYNANMTIKNNRFENDTWIATYNILEYDCTYFNIFIPENISGPVKYEFTAVILKLDYAVIVRGGPISDSWFDDEADKAYNTLKARGYLDINIFYLSTNKNHPNVDYEATKSNIDQVFTILSVLGINKQLFVYFTDHGKNGGYFYLKDINDLAAIRPWEIDAWLDQVLYSKCVIFIDACFSGDFIWQLSATNRIVITSTDGSHYSYARIFTYEFFDSLRGGVSIGWAWEDGDRDAYERKPGLMSPQIDDNGDRVGHGNINQADTLPLGGDGYVARSTFL